MRAAFELISIKSVCVCLCVGVWKKDDDDSRVVIIELP